MKKKTSKIKTTSSFNQFFLDPFMDQTILGFLQILESVNIFIGSGYKSGSESALFFFFINFIRIQTFIKKQLGILTNMNLRNILGNLQLETYCDRHESFVNNSSVDSEESSQIEINNIFFIFRNWNDLQENRKILKYFNIQFQSPKSGSKSTQISDLDPDQT